MYSLGWSGSSLFASSSKEVVPFDCALASVDILMHVTTINIRNILTNVSLAISPSNHSNVVRVSFDSQTIFCQQTINFC